MPFPMKWHDCLVRTVAEGRLQGKKGRGRLRKMPLSWLLNTKEGNMDYIQLKWHKTDQTGINDNGNLPYKGRIQQRDKND